MQKKATIASLTILDTPRFRVKKNTLKTYAGQIQPDYYLIEAQPGVIVVPVTKNQTILFVSQYRHGVDQILLELPAGSKHDGETFPEAAERELLEETGTIAKTLSPLGVIASQPSLSTQIAHVFVAEGVAWKQPQHLDQEESLEIMEMPLEEVILKIKHHDIWASDTLAALLHYLIIYQSQKRF